MNWSWFDLIAALLVMAAILSYLNYRLLKLPTTVGLMALTLLASVAVVAIGRVVPQVRSQARQFITQLQLDKTLLHGMLGFLLFAGALPLDLGELKRHRIAIAVLATLGVLLSTALVGSLTWLVLSLLGTPIALIYCLLFGALISPTDPIAVLGLLKNIGAIVILRGKTFNVGDRIRMSGVRGDVIALGFMQTTIMEMGQPPSVQADDPAMWVRSRQYTGRVVTVSNAKIFDEPVYNYTRDFPYIWEEIKLPISYTADRERAEHILLETAKRHTVPLAQLSHDLPPLRLQDTRQPCEKP